MSERDAGIAVLVDDHGWRGIVVYDPRQPRIPSGKPGGGRWIRIGFGLPSLEPGGEGKSSVPEGGERSWMFQDPYHTSKDQRASPRFEPLGKPEASPRRKNESKKDYEARAKKERQASARTKLGEAPALLGVEIEAMIDGMALGEEKRLPEGTLVTCNASGDDQHYRIDGPDGTFWRIPKKDAAKLAEFEETTARADRFGEEMPGNPMVALLGVDAPGDPYETAIGKTLHEGTAPLPRGGSIKRMAKPEGDIFRIKSATGVTRDVPATDKEQIIATARELEKAAEGKVGGAALKPAKPHVPTRHAKNPNGPLQPLPPGYDKTRICLHAESERVLGYEHGGNEVALIQTENGFGTPQYIDRDGEVTVMKVDGTDTVVVKDGKEVARDPISGPGPHADPACAKSMADFLALAAKVQRDLREEGVDPGFTIADRFDEPILWPEHLDIAVELGAGDPDNPGARATYGASPGDEAHPEPYFYVSPWAGVEAAETWDAEGFNGAQLTYAEVLASDDQEKTIRDWYLHYMDLLGGRKPKEQREAGSMPLSRAKTLYSGGMSGTVNRYLRKQSMAGRVRDKDGNELTDKEKDKLCEEMIPALDKLIAQGKPVEGPLYRGLDLRNHPELKAKLQKGNSFHDDGYVSTSDLIQVANNFTGYRPDRDPIVLNIKLPSGGARALHISSQDLEAELLLARGGTFHVTSDPYDTSYFGIGVKVVDVEWRPREP